MRRSKRIWLGMIGVFLLVFGVTFIAHRIVDQDVKAANFSGFDAGYIISDYQMTNYNSMNEAQIQNFLKSKVNCNDTDLGKYTKGNKVGYFSESLPYTWHVAGGHFVCMADENINGESAAHIIWQAAQDYRINPQVLITVLQKEQWIVTDSFPHSVQYKSAMGYACPDTAPCAPGYAGFKNQVRGAASLFREVMDGGWSNYPVGNTYVQYNQNAGCGGSVVNIRNKATSALYRYTPYQPNAAALSVPMGVEVSCGAYGNKNFYGIFEDWFGGITDDERPPVEAKSKGRTLEDGIYQIVSKAYSNRTIDIYGGVKSGMSSGRIVPYDRKTSDMNNQLFEIKYDESNGYYSITNPVSGLSLDVEKEGRRNNTPVIAWSQNTGCNQDWVFEKDGNGYYTIMSRCSSKVLDITTSNNLIIFDNYNSGNQKWQLVKVAESKGRVVQDGVYNLAAKSNLNKVIDIKGGVTKGMSSGETTIFDKKIFDNNNQKFEVKYNEKSGYYNIINPITGLVFDVNGGGVSNNTRIIMWAKNGTCNQDWVIEQVESEYYKIISRCSSRVLDATASNNLIIFDNHNGNNQKWRFEAISEGRTVEDGTYQFVSKASGEAIDIKGGIHGGMSSGELIVYEKKETNKDNQLFEIKYNEKNGYYNIVNPNTGLAFDVKGAGVNNLTPVIVWPQNTGCNQDWLIRGNANEGYMIASRCSNRVIDATSSGKIIIFDAHGGSNQRWKLVN